MGDPTPIHPQLRVRTWRLDTLRSRLDLMRQRFGAVPDLTAAEGLQRGIDRRNARIAFLSNQMAEVGAEIETLQREVNGLEAGVESVLQSVLDDLEARHLEAWSPVPIVGYRLWWIKGNRVTGAVEDWDGPTKQAMCLGEHSDSTDIPHSDGRCGPPACGIYATKTIPHLIDGIGRPERMILGLVGMDGKVVEHTHGYRCARATVLAAMALTPERYLYVDEPHLVGLLFKTPDGFLRLAGTMHDDVEWHFRTGVELLKEHERSLRWTSDNKSA